LHCWFGRLKSPSSRITEENAKFEWTSRHDEVFQLCKNAVIKQCLAHFDTNAATFLYVDAGPKGVSAILMQIQNNQLRIISTASHSLITSELNNSQVDKEIFSAVWGLLHFKWYLIGMPFKIRCDNLPVCQLLDKQIDTKRKMTSRHQTWRSKIAAFNYEMEHIKSEDNYADFLSRCHDSYSTNTSHMETLYEVEVLANITRICALSETHSIKTSIAKVTIEDIIKASISDNTLNELRISINSGSLLDKSNAYFSILTKNIYSKQIVSC